MEVEPFKHKRGDTFAYTATFQPEFIVDGATANAGSWEENHPDQPNV